MIKQFLVQAILLFICNQVQCTENANSFQIFKLESNLEKKVIVGKGYTNNGKLISVITQPFVITKDIEVKDLKIESNIDVIVKAAPKYGFQYVGPAPVTKNLEKHSADLFKGQNTLVDTSGNSKTVFSTTEAYVIPPEHAVFAESDKAYTIGVARGDNSDWEIEKMYEAIKALNASLTDIK